jgi:hypothetical protein
MVLRRAYDTGDEGEKAASVSVRRSPPVSKSTT